MLLESRFRPNLKTKKKRGHWLNGWQLRTTDIERDSAAANLTIGR